MTKKPIEYFKSDDEFQKCCKWWQHRLFLDNWFISFEMVDGYLTMEDDESERIMSGMCEFDFNNREANITVVNTKQSIDDSIIKEIAELTIVHELLHIKQEYIINIEPENETSFHKYVAHQELEAMAKTLLMVKYNLDYDYFYKGRK